MRKLLAVLLIAILCVSASATITVGGISEDGDSGVNSRTLQTVGAVAGGSIIVMMSSQAQLCDWTASSWSAGTVTATLTTSDASSCKSQTIGTWVCVGHVLPAGYNGCFTVTGSSSTTVQYALAADPGGVGTQFGGGSIDPITPTDNASGGSNTYTLITDGTNNARTYVSVAIYIANNITLAAGSAQPTINCTLQTGELGVTCGAITVTGLATSSVVDQVSAFVQRNNVTAIATPSIQGTVSPEFFVAFSGTFNLTANTVTACGGNTFTNFNVGNNDGIGGYPPAYFTSSLASTYCANLSETPSGDAWPLIVSLKGLGAVANNATTHGGKLVMGGKFVTQ